MRPPSDSSSRHSTGRCGEKGALGAPAGGFDTERPQPERGWAIAGERRVRRSRSSPISRNVDHDLS
jgi:hypothetical protein